MNLVWTRDAPTEPGWYWIRPIESIVRISARRDRLYVKEDGEKWVRLEEATPFAEWAGPIPEPTEPEEQA